MLVVISIIGKDISISNNIINFDGNNGNSNERQ